MIDAWTAEESAGRPPDLTAEVQKVQSGIQELRRDLKDLRVQIVEEKVIKSSLRCYQELTSSRSLERL
jgi:peptidoglycan hydrolase CwlO-like protein